MPVILEKENENKRLNPDFEAENLLSLLKPLPADKMEEWEVGNEARNPRNDYPELINPKPHKTSRKGSLFINFLKCQVFGR
jgi:putative SOS response-associated peptidase YedK